MNKLLAVVLVVALWSGVALAQQKKTEKKQEKKTGQTAGQNTRLFGGLGGAGGGLLGQVSGLAGAVGSAFLHGAGRPINQIPGGYRPGGYQPGIGIGGRPIGGIHPGGIGGIHPGGIGGIGGIHPGGIGGGFPPTQASCRYWCRTPQNQAYCCEGSNQPQSFVGVKPGQCPPVRPVCPPTRNFGPPNPCSNDGSCGGINKCCFDTCLQQHTCKPPIGYGR